MSRLFAANFMAVIFIILFSITQPSAGSIFTWPQLDISLLWQWFWSDSFFFSCYLIPTYWCIAEFFSGDIITFLIISFSPKDNEKKLLSILVVFYIFMASTCRGIWVANCLAGAILWSINRISPAFLKHKSVLLMLAAVCIACCRLPDYTTERYANYFLWGISDFLLLIICFRSRALKKILSLPVISRLGSYTFDLYLSHVIVMNTCLGYFHTLLLPYIPRGFLLAAGYLFCFIVSLILALIIKTVSSKLQNFLFTAWKRSWIKNENL